MTKAAPEPLERARNGDPVAFQELVRPHIPKLRRLAYAYCRNWHEADDVAQDALLKAYRSFHTYRARASLLTWLYAVTRSACHDWYRRRRVAMSTNTTELSPDQRDMAEGQEHLLERKTEVERLWAAIHQLPQEFRVPLVLSDVEGLSYEEISQLECIPMGTVRSRLWRARRKLCELMEGAEPGATGADSAPPREAASTRSLGGGRESSLPLGKVRRVTR